MNINTFLLLLLMFFAAQFARAEGDGSHSGVTRKVEKKIKSRWSLSDWMEQKKNMKWQDQWLAINTSDNPFEFYIEGESSEMTHYLTESKDIKTKYHRTRGRAGAYASIVGLEGGYEAEEKGWKAWDASFNLRLFGTAQQNTHITLQAGLKSYAYTSAVTTETEQYQNTFAGVETAIYLNRYFGIEGNYRKILPENSNKGTSLEGETSRAYLFIDFSFVRVYGGWNKEYLIFNNTLPTRTSENRDGYMGGIRLWF